MVSQHHENQINLSLDGSNSNRSALWRARCPVDYARPCGLSVTGEVAGRLPQDGWLRVGRLFSQCAGNVVAKLAFIVPHVVFETSMTEHPLFTSLIRKIRKLASISEDDECALLSLSHRVSRVGARQYLVREGTMPTECCLLIQGFAARAKVADDGGRQIVSFHIAGDILDLQHLFLKRADHDVQTMTEATVVWVPMTELRALIAERPAIGKAFWRDALIDASIFREWVLNVGRRDAKTRIAHMLCEFVTRSTAAGLGTPDQIRLPFNQEEIGDATGLTSVHVNRMMRELSEEGLIKREGRTLSIQNWIGFQRVAGFDPGYLHAAA